MKHRKKTMAFVLCIFLFTVLFFQVDIVISKEKIERIVIGERFKIHSNVLNENRTILVSLPKGYQKSKRSYPVLYLLDAEFFFQQAVATVEFLSDWPEYLRNQGIPQMIIVGIVNIDRNRDYTHTHAPRHLSVFLSSKMS
jgi:predicted alpha/beta superfamily hydrolase